MVALGTTEILFPKPARRRQNQPMGDNYPAITGGTKWAPQNLFASSRSRMV